MNHTETKKNRIQFIILLFILPITLTCITYLGFLPNRLPQKFLFNAHIWITYFSQGVFASRILGMTLLHGFFQFSQFLQHHHLLPKLFLFGAVIDSKYAVFYYALLLENLTFFILSNCVAYAILSSKPFELTFEQRKQSLFVLSFLIAITQYVPMHYDNLFYFLMLVCMYFIWCRRKVAILLTTFLLAILTRETAAIILSILGADYIYRHRLKFNKDLYQLGAFILIFIISYFLLKYFTMSAKNNIYEHKWILNTVGHRFYATISILFFSSIVVFFNNSKTSQRRTLIFLAFCLPYILPMPWIAVIWEARIWMPILIPILFITQLPKNYGTAS